MPGRAKMPKLYDDIHKHILASGYPAKFAWGATVNAVRKGCLEGDANFPGKQNFGAIARTKYCAAYAEYKKSHPGTSAKGLAR